MRLTVHTLGDGMGDAGIPVPAEFVPEVDRVALDDGLPVPTNPPDILCLSGQVAAIEFLTNNVETLARNTVAVLVDIGFSGPSSSLPRLDTVTDCLAECGFRFAGFPRLNGYNIPERPIGQRATAISTDGTALFLKSVSVLSETDTGKLPALAFSALCFDLLDIAMSALSACPETHLEPPQANWISVLRRLQIADAQEPSLFIGETTSSLPPESELGPYASEDRTRIERILFDTGFTDLSDQTRETRLREVRLLQAGSPNATNGAAPLQAGELKALAALRTLRTPNDRAAFLNTIVRHGFGKDHSNLFWGDRLMSLDKSAGFFENAEFQNAWHANKQWHRYDQYDGLDGIAWRLHTLEWAAKCALSLPSGDFVECGVFRGDMSAFVFAVCGLAHSGRTLYLFDSFEGIDPDRATAEESRDHIDTANRVYRQGDLYQHVTDRFAGGNNVVITQGFLPESLDGVDLGEIAWLHLDLNAAGPEVQTLERLFDKVVPGGTIILDDYGWALLRPQKDAHDKFFESRGYRVLELPTGQGLVTKRPG